MNVEIKQEKIYMYIYNINMTKCQYQQCKRVLNTRVERIKKMEIK